MDDMTEEERAEEVRYLADQHRRQMALTRNQEVWRDESKRYPPGHILSDLTSGD